MHVPQNIDLAWSLVSPYASAPVQLNCPGPVFRFNLIVAIEGLAHAVSQVLGKSLDPTPLVLTFDVLNFQVCLHISQYIHRRRNRVKARRSDERAYLEEKIVSQRLPKHLISFLKAPGLLRMNQLGHTHVNDHFPKRPVLKLCRTYARK